MPSITEFQIYQQSDMNFFQQEQTRQHAVTIVAMEERLLRLTRQNRQLEQDVMYSKQITGKNLPLLLSVILRVA